MSVTVYQRIVAYAEANDRVLITPEHRLKVGKLCKRKWFSYYKGQEKFPVQKVNIVEDGICFTVVEYPNKFARHIDEVVRQYYEEILPKRTAENPAKKQRKRIPIPKKTEKVFSFSKEKL